MNPYKTALPVLLLLASIGSVLGQKLSPDLVGPRASESVDVIVQYKSVPTAEQHQRVVNRGGILKATHPMIQSASYRISAAELAELASDPDVAHVSLDHPLHALDVTSGVIAQMSPVSSIAIDYFRESVDTDASDNPTYIGTGVVIALIDSGVTVNADLKGGLLYQQSFVPGDSTTADAYGHGTHVAGMLIGSGKNSSGPNSKYQFGGAAPGASLVSLRVLDQNGSSTDSTVISAIERAITLKSTYNIRIISLSLGRPPAESYAQDPLCQAVEAAWKAGIVVVVAAGNEGRNNSAGNEGYGTILAPGNDPYVITVGAMKSMSTPYRSDDLIASYSSKGPTLIDHVVKPDLVAPGNLIISVAAPKSTLAQTYPANIVPQSVYLYQSPVASAVSSSSTSDPANSYFVLSGTSMATPVVSSAAASLLQKNPSLTPDQIKARLMKTASKTFPVSSVAVDPTTGISYTSYYDIFTVGAGYLDTAAALANNDLATGSALSPTVTYNASNNTASLVSGSGVIWGSSIIWGTSLVWGTNVFVSGSSLIWGSGVSWGTATPTGQSIIWGTTTASATGIIWGTSGTSATALVTGE